MDAPPSLILVFDASAVTAGKTREWQWFSGLGDCWLPQTVLDELEFLCSRAGDPAIESTAREFSRFFPDSDWQVTDITETHPSLKPASGQALSKRARIALSVAQTAYGVAKGYPGTLVVLVANEQSLLRRVQGLGIPTLTGVSVSALLQWHRTGQPPAAIDTKLQALKSGAPLPRTAGSQTRPQGSSASASASRQRPSSASRKSIATAQPYSSNATGSSLKSQLMATVLTVLFLTVGGALLWKLVQPESFDRTWQQLGLPSLPGKK